jgi:nucleoid DNA-binding protein
MNKSNLVKKLSDITGLTCLDAEKAILGITLVITNDVLEEGSSITLPGFGTFRQVIIPSRDIKHPSTGEILHVPNRKKIGFRMCCSLKE